MKTLQQRIEHAAKINATTCAREASPENNYNVIRDLKATIYALVMELETVANWLKDGEGVTPDAQQMYRDLANTYRDAYHAKLSIKGKAEEAATQ